MRKRKRRERRKDRLLTSLGAAATVILGVALAVGVSYQVSSGKAGGTPTLVARPVASAFRLPTFQAPVPDGISPEPGATGSGTTIGPVAVAAPQPSVAPNAPLGQAGLDILSDRSWIFDYVVEQERARQREHLRQDLIIRLTAYMTGHHHVQELVDLVPLMVDLGEQTGVDCRLCPATLNEESSGGRGSHNLFGALGSDIGGCGYEAQVRWYFGRLAEISASRGFAGDVWYLAWFWHGGGSPGPDHSSYADNITRVVQAI